MKKQLSVSLALVLVGLLSSAVASAAQSRPGTGTGTGGKSRCIDRCTDRYLDCQFDNAPGSLDEALCDQKFDRCAQMCDLIYTRTGAGSVLKNIDQAVLSEAGE